MLARRAKARAHGDMERTNRGVGGPFEQEKEDPSVKPRNGHFGACWAVVAVYLLLLFSAGDADNVTESHREVGQLSKSGDGVSECKTKASYLFGQRGLASRWLISKLMQSATCGSLLECFVVSRGGEFGACQNHQTQRLHT